MDHLEGMTPKPREDVCVPKATPARWLAVWRPASLSTNSGLPNSSSSPASSSEAKPAVILPEDDLTHQHEPLKIVLIVWGAGFVADASFPETSTLPESRECQ